MKRANRRPLPQWQRNKSERIFDAMLVVVRETRPDLVVLLELGARTRTTAERELLSRLLSVEDASWLRQILESCERGTA